MMDHDAATVADQLEQEEIEQQQQQQQQHQYTTIRTDPGAVLVQIQVRYELPDTINNINSSDNVNQRQRQTTIRTWGNDPNQANKNNPNSNSDSSYVMVEPAHIGLPPTVLPSKPLPGDYSYRGMHDGGPLPPPRQGGPMATLIAAVQHAKTFHDAYLTSVMEQQEKSTTTLRQQQQQPKETSTEVNDTDVEKDSVLPVLKKTKVETRRDA